MYVLDFVTQSLKEIRVNFVYRIITGDDARIQSHEPETKLQSIQWQHTLHPVSKKIHVAARCRKPIVDIVLGVQGPKLEIDIAEMSLQQA
jgi:hypothetical protein